MTRLLCALLVTLLLSACGGGRPVNEEADGYSPVPDDVLYAEIAKMPGVTEVNLEFSTKLGTANSYRGEVVAAPGTDGLALLDNVFRTLRKGRLNAYFKLRVTVVGDKSYMASNLRVLSLPALEERYGPQVSGK